MSPSPPAGHKEIQAISRIDNPYVSHNHEITDGLGKVRKAFGMPLAGQWEYAIVLCRRHAIEPNDDLTGTLSHLGELETMHTAEHTDKKLCYRYASPSGKIYLFVGDSIYPDHDVPKTLLTKAHGGDKTILVVTLDHMKPLQINVVLLSVAPGQLGEIETMSTRWVSALDEATMERIFGGQPPPAPPRNPSRRSWFFDQRSLSNSWP